MPLETIYVVRHGVSRVTHDQPLTLNHPFDEILVVKTTGYVTVIGTDKIFSESSFDLPGLLTTQPASIRRQSLHRRGYLPIQP